MVEELPCVVNPPVFVSVDEAGDGRPSGCQLVDLKVQRHAAVVNISFQNYYTCSLSVLACDSGGGVRGGGGGGGGEEWRVCVGRLELMPDCHSEQGGEDCVVLNMQNLPGGGHLEGPVCLRLVLRQPSQNWREFGVRDLKCYTAAQHGHTPSHDPPQATPISRHVARLVELAGRAHGSGRGNHTPRTMQAPAQPHEVKLLS